MISFIYHEAGQLKNRGVTKKVLDGGYPKDTAGEESQVGGKGAKI